MNTEEISGYDEYFEDSWLNLSIQELEDKRTELKKTAEVFFYAANCEISDGCYDEAYECRDYANHCYKKARFLKRYIKKLKELQND
jgi:hypothetical protein